MKTTIENFTLNQLLKVTKDLDDSVEVYNSCYHENYTEELLEAGRISDFEPIFYLDEEDMTAVFDFPDKNRKPIRLAELRTLPIELGEKSIERDVEDGYVYQFYDSMVFNDKYLVLC